MSTPEASPNGRADLAVSFLARLSTYVANALRYWEPRRLIYNAVLALVVVGEVAANWAVFSQRITVDLVLGLFILAVLANVAYCAVYAADLFVQFSGLDGPWRRGRILVLIVGTAFGAALAHFFVMGSLSV
jgi:hypothetical protein